MLQRIKKLKNYIQLVSYRNFKSILNLKTILKHIFILFSAKPRVQQVRHRCADCETDRLKLRRNPRALQTNVLLESVKVTILLKNNYRYENILPKLLILKEFKS